MARSRANCSLQKTDKLGPLGCSTVREVPFVIVLEIWFDQFIRQFQNDHNIKRNFGATKDQNLQGTTGLWSD